MKTALSILFALLLFSCKKNEGPYQPVQLSSELTNNMDTIYKYLPGRWEWVEDRMITREGYVYYTPKTENYNEDLSFSSDTIIFIRTGKAALVHRFRVVPEREITLWPEDEQMGLATYDFATGSFSSFDLIKICKDQLILLRNYRNETPDRIYKRKQ